MPFIYKALRLFFFGGDGGNRNRKALFYRIFTKCRKRPPHNGLKRFMLHGVSLRIRRFSRK